MPEETLAATTPSAATVTAPVTPTTQPVVSTTPPAPIDKAGKPATDATSEASILDNANAEGKKKAEGDAKPAAETPKDGASAPEKYELKAPEGTTLNPSDIEAFTPLAKELGLSNDAAQKLIDFEAARMKSFTEAQDANFKQFVNGMKAETVQHYTDQQKAGGPSMKEAMVFVAKARGQFVPPALQEKWNMNGMANDKDTIIMLEKMGRQISEDSLVEGSRNLNREATAQDLYPSMKQT